MFTNFAKELRHFDQIIQAVFIQATKDNKGGRDGLYCALVKSVLVAKDYFFPEADRLCSPGGDAWLLMQNDRLWKR